MESRVYYSERTSEPLIDTDMDLMRDPDTGLGKSFIDLYDIHFYNSEDGSSLRLFGGLEVEFNCWVHIDKIIQAACKSTNVWIHRCTTCELGYLEETNEFAEFQATGNQKLSISIFEDRETNDTTVKLNGVYISAYFITFDMKRLVEYLTNRNIPFSLDYDYAGEYPDPQGHF